MAQRGAMFGLDARIALIIFTVLSTITGFVLYQRAEEAQDIKLYANFQEVERGLKLLQRDMGVLPGHAMIDGINGAIDDHFGMLCDLSFVAAGFQKRWKGPYISARSACNTDFYKTLSINYTIAYADSTATAAVPPQAVANNCTATSTCYAWIGISSLPLDAFTYINRIVDEANGETTEPSPASNGRVVFSSGTLWYRTGVHK